jgi:hypothetical protein
MHLITLTFQAFASTRFYRLHHVACSSDATSLKLVLALQPSAREFPPSVFFVLIEDALTYPSVDQAVVVWLINLAHLRVFDFDFRSPPSMSDFRSPTSHLPAAHLLQASTSS